ncbi:MAG: MBL fold metallo-hydrolase [Chloroflexota bacterium]
MNIVNLGYDSTHYYLLADSRPRLLIDVGWPGTLPKLQHQCKQKGIVLTEIRHFLATHYHPDHAGLAQELKRAGSKLIVLENQLAAIPTLGTFMKPQNNYLEIDPTDNLVVTFAESRGFLAALGIQGEIIATPGHSDDSVSLILDEGVAFTGDLPHPLMLPDDSGDPARQSWAKLRAHKVKTVYPGHGPSVQLE